MQINIRHAEMKRREDGSYLGSAHLEVSGHKTPYEVILHSEDGKDWGFAVHFLHSSGPEEEITALEAFIEENDDAFARLVEAAMDTMESDREN